MVVVTQPIFHSYDTVVVDKPHLRKKETLSSRANNKLVWLHMIISSHTVRAILGASTG